MKKILLIVLITFVSTSYAKGILAYKSADCGQWVQARKENRAGYFEAHLVGYVNGLAVGAGIDLWVRANGNKVSKEQLFLWMDNWCQNNPLEEIGYGAYVFADEQTNGVYKNRYLPK